jgi:hypothetical protein
MKIRIRNEEIGPCPQVEPIEFPKYATLIINRANRIAQGTRPRVVGQLTELFKEFPGRTLVQWEHWYTERKPTAIGDATEKILSMVGNLKDAIEKIDKGMVETWVRDLVITKTFVGLRVQRAILAEGARIAGTDYRFATSAEESKGIDGYIANMPVSIKPKTYDLNPELEERLAGKVIYYEEVKDGIEVDYGEFLCR